MNARMLGPALFAAAALAAGLPAQNPPGWVVASTYRDGSNTWPGPGGLWFLHPRDASQPVRPVANLPAGLTGAANTTSGANCVVWRASDDALIAGDYWPLNGQASLHVLTVVNPASPIVAQAASIPVGQVVSQWGGGVVDLAVLPNQDILFVTFGVGASILGPNTYLGILDARTNAITPYPVQFPPNFVPGLNALAVDTQGQFAYLATNTVGYAVDIYRVPLGQSNPQAVFLLTVPTLVTSMKLDPTDRFLTAVTRGAGQLIVTIDVVTSAIVNSCTGLNDYNGLCTEDHSDGFFAVYRTAPTGPHLVGWLSNPCATILPLAGAPATGWGRFSGVAAIGSLRPFGDATTNANAYKWLIRPNLGGMPLVGNVNFCLGLEGSPAAVPGVWLLSLARLSTPTQLLGVRLWLDSSSPILAGTLVCTGTRAGVPLPIPNLPLLRDVRLYFQAFSPSGIPAAPLDASAGLEVVLI